MRTTLFRGILFGFSVFVFAALVWSVARAEVLEGKVRLLGDQAPFKVTYREAGKADGISLSGMEFRLESRDNDAIVGSRAIDTPRGQVFEHLSVFFDHSVVDRFRGDPKRAAMEFGLENYTEAVFPAGANVLLIWSRNQMGALKNFGNCFELRLK